MAAPENITLASDLAVALDREFVKNFSGEYDRLAEILGIFAPETVAAGTALYQLEIAGELNDSSGDNGSSGTAYVEGDLVALSKFTAKKVPMGDVKVMPYRRMTTAQSILKSGVEVAVYRTDKKMISKIRNAIVKQFFTFLATGTGSATAGKTLQAALANVDATLGDSLEKNDDEGGRLVHFVNRQDAAAYLGSAQITTQTVFGMGYLQSFLGVTDVFMTNQVDAGTVWATPVDNIHVFAPDFGALASASLAYQTESNGLIGAAHTPAYDHVSVETNVLTGLTLLPEVKDYIAKAAITPSV